MWICAYCRGDKVLSCAAGRWGERWRRSATCRSALRTSLPSEHLLSESWRQHCGACQLLLPHKPPCMQNRLRLPSLLGHAVSTSPPPFLSVTNKQTCLYSAPPHPGEPESAFNSISSRQMCSETATSDWDNFRRRSTSRAASDKKQNKTVNVLLIFISSSFRDVRRINSSAR